MYVNILEENWTEGEGYEQLIYFEGGGVQNFWKTFAGKENFKDFWLLKTRT